MDFSEFPAQWEWIALILGGVALIMATPTFLEMYWGRPKIKLDFTSRVISGCTVLECEIQNAPISSKILRLLGVSRQTAQDITAAFKIFKHGTKEVVVPLIIPKLLREGTPVATHILLPSSLFPARFVIVSRDMTTSVAQVYDNSQVLTPGEYTVSAITFLSEKKIKGYRSFAVHGDGGIYWLSN